MRFSLFTIAIASAAVTSAAVIKRDAAPITAAIASVKKAVTHQDLVIAKFPDTATFATFDEAGDALTDRIKDLEEVINKSDKIGFRDSLKVIDALVDLVPAMQKGLQLVIDKKAAFAAQDGAAKHVKEELEDDQKKTQAIGALLQDKLTIANPQRLITAGTKMAEVFQNAVTAYKNF